MKPYVKMATICACSMLSMLIARNGFAQGAKLQLDALDHLSGKAKEVVNVNLDESMVQQASAMSGKAPDAKAQEVLQGLKGVYVRSFEFTGRNGYSDTDVEAVRTQLKAPAWSRIVSVHDDGELVEIYVWKDSTGGPGGLAIIAADGQELTVVNLVGRVNLGQLGALGGQLGIPALPGGK